MAVGEELDPETRWNSRGSDLCNDLAHHCAIHADWPKSLEHLNQLVNTLMTEFWDVGFSQTEIRNSFNAALADMPRYAAGEESNGTRP